MARGVRVYLDAREGQTPGWKFNEWEMRGAPLRMEIGPKDLEKSTVVLARRDTREKSFVPMDGLAAHVEGLLATIQQALLDRAIAFRSEHTSETDSYDEFKATMDGRPGFVVSPWCGTAECETAIKNERRPRSATSRSSPPRRPGRSASSAAIRPPCTPVRQSLLTMTAFVRAVQTCPVRHLKTRP